MKKTIYALCFFTLMMSSATAFGQVYKTAEDTAKLNKEFTEVSNDIANLTAKLTVAQNNMPGYRSKASSADADAQDAALSSSNQADKATTRGGVKEARKAKRQAKKSYREAKDARSANKDIENQDDKIASLKGQLAKKQERLDQLTAMRTAINVQYPQ
jgi:chromosome segregation ATPase